MLFKLFIVFAIATLVAGVSQDSPSSHCRHAYFHSGLVALVQIKWSVWLLWMQSEGESPGSQNQPYSEFQLDLELLRLLMP